MFCQIYVYYFLLKCKEIKVRVFWCFVCTVQYPGILHNYVWNPNKECPAPLFGFISDAICCNILIGSVYTTHSLVAMVNEKWLLGCNSVILAWVSSFYLCTVEMVTWTTIRRKIHWLVVFPSNYGKFISCDGSTIDSTTSEFIYVFLFCYGAIIVKKLFCYGASQFSLTVPEAPILIKIKNFRR